MPDLKQVIDVPETPYPLHYAEEWDEPGLVVNDLGHDVHHIVFATDPTSAIIDKAIATGADLLTTHHPLFFHSVHETSGLGFRGDVVRRLHQHGCGLRVGHINAGVAYRGVGQAAADYFGLTGQKPLMPIDDADASHPIGLGRVGRLPKPVVLKDFARRVFDEVSDHGVTSIPGIQICGNSDIFVQYVAILPDSGGSLFNEVHATGTNVCVISDLCHHPVIDAIEQARYEAHMRSQGIMLGHGMAGESRVHPCFINTPHTTIESMWFNCTVGDVPATIKQATGVRPEVEWSHDATDSWTLSITAHRD